MRDMNILEQAVLTGKGAELVNPEPVGRNPWGSVKDAELHRQNNEWIDEMVKGGLLSKKEGEALKIKVMTEKSMAIDPLSQDPKFLKKVFGK